MVLARVRSEADRAGELIHATRPRGWAPALEPEDRELLLGFIRNGGYADATLEIGRQDPELADQ